MIGQFIKYIRRHLKYLPGERKPMKTRNDIAQEKFSSGYNCSQSVLYSFCDDLHLDKDTALRLACGFGGGIAKRQEICGAVSGGILAIGLKHGRGEGQEKPVTEAMYLKVRALTSRFEARHGSCSCRALLNGCDLNTPEGQLYFKENDLMNKTCKECVKTVVMTLEEIL